MKCNTEFKMDQRKTTDKNNGELAMSGEDSFFLLL